MVTAHSNIARTGLTDIAGNCMTKCKVALLASVTEHDKTDLPWPILLKIAWRSAKLRYSSSFIYNLTNFVLTGVRYKDECSVENMIPIHLIVLGSFSLFYTCCVGGNQYRSYNQLLDQEAEPSVNPLRLLLDLFLTAWFICGYVWIYRNYELNYEYCKKTLYLFAFWGTTSYLMFSGLALLLMCGVYAFIVLFGNRFRNIELQCNCCWVNNSHVGFMATTRTSKATSFICTVILR